VSGRNVELDESLASELRGEDDQEVKLVARDAAAAAAAAAALIGPVSNALSSGSSNLAIVKWRGDLEPVIYEEHGKVVMNDRDSYGGTIAVKKRDSAWIGAEHNVVFKRNGQEIAKVYLETFYSGGQPIARLVYGDQNFAQETVTEHGSTCLILVLI